MNNRRAVLRWAAGVFWVPRWAVAGTLADKWRGRIFITKERVAIDAPAKVLAAAVKKTEISMVWPKEEKGNEHAVWTVSYIAFFAEPLDDYEVALRFWDVTSGPRHYVGSREQFTRNKQTRVISADLTLAKPDFEQNHRYLLAIEKSHRTIASTRFWLRGKAPRYSGRVDFSKDSGSP
jgi:hypothetical protein